MGPVPNPNQGREHGQWGGGRFNFFIGGFGFLPLFLFFNPDMFFGNRDGAPLNRDQQIMRMLFVVIMMAVMTYQFFGDAIFL